MVVTLVVLASLADGPPALAQGAGTQPLTGQVMTYQVRRGDTLSSLGARYGVHSRTLASDNRMDITDILEVGRSLRIDNRHVVPDRFATSTLVVNIPQRMLFYTNADVAAFPIAVGRATWPTPAGDFIVTTREENPTWDVPASILAEMRRAGRSHPARVPPGPQNPLGAFWLGLSGGGIGIHGTNAPSSVYRFASHGCIRLHPDDIAWLFPRINVGDAVSLIYQPVLVASVGDRVFLEVHPDVYQQNAPTLAQVRELAAGRGLTGRIDWGTAARVVHLRDGVARDVTRAKSAEAGEGD
jgi:L,D-transpeptidase ErfK/SrfK